MDHGNPSGPSILSGARHSSALGGQYNAVGRDMSVVHISYPQGHTTTSQATPPTVPPNPAEAPSESRTGVESGLS